MKRSGAIGNKVAVTRRHIGEYDANRRLDSHDIRKITKDLILVNNEVSTKFGGVAQLGEHLPCKQGVKSSNLSVSIVDVIKQLQSTLYLENFIQMI